MTQNPSAQPILPAESVAIETRQGPNWLKWSLGCAGLGMLLFTGIITLFVIVMPIGFRSLLPQQQAEILKHAPFMQSFMPTREYAADTLPTAQSVNSSAVAALLNQATTVLIVPTVLNSPTPTSIPAITRTPLSSVLATLTPTSLLAASPTFSASPTAIASPTTLVTATDLPTATDTPLPSSFHLTGIKRVPQGWNDCGPANITQALGYYGWTGTQEDAIAVLKPNNEDRNVSPWEMVRFVNQHTGVKAISRVSGDLTLIKHLLVAQFAVIMETGYIVAGEGWAGHYLTVLGYDDVQHIIFGGDSNLGFGADGLGQREDYTDIDTRWREFNRQYIVIYPHEREAVLAVILGSDADPTYNANHALQTAQSEAKAMPDNQFAWFNIGSSLTMLGQYQQAAIAFDQSRNVGSQLPYRMAWYQFTPYEAYYNAQRFDDVLSIVQATLGTTQYVEETWYWRGMVEAAKGQNDAAIKDFDAVRKFNPGFTAAAEEEARVKVGTFIPPSAGGFGHTAPTS